MYFQSNSAKIMTIIPNVLVNSSSYISLELYVNNPNYAETADLLIYYSEVNNLREPINQVI